MLLAAAVTGLGSAGAEAATYCVQVEAPACDHQRATAAVAFEDAASGGADTIMLGRLTEAGEFGDGAGQPVHVVGAGRGVTVLAGTLDLGQGGSSVTGVSARGLLLSGTGADLAVEGPARLRGGSELRSSTIAGPLATAGTVSAQSVAVTGSGIDVESGSLTAGHLTVFGAGAAGVRIAGGAAATVSNSIVWGFGQSFQGAATVAYSNGTADPAFVAPPGDLRLRADSPLVDAGDPAPLTQAEPHEDARGDVRAVDGNGDGTARRDIGALERHPPPLPATGGNVLTNPGAEQGQAAHDDTTSFRPPGWTRTGGFTSVRYGTVMGNVAFPTLAAAEALAAGRAFFAGGPSGVTSLTQVVDVSERAPEIDARAASVSLSALLGGYRGSPDAAVVAAEFRDPFGARLRELALDMVSPAERAHATMLLARAAQARIPRLTRTIAVTVRAGAHGGKYNDAYVDDITLVPGFGRVRGLPGPARPRRPRPFSGVAVMSPRAGVDRKRRAWVRLGCPDATVGRCAGVVTLTARKRGVVGSVQFRLRPGRMRNIAVRLFRPDRRHFPRERGRRIVRLHGHVFTSARDRQGLTRSRTAPLRLERPRRR